MITKNRWILLVFRPATLGILLLALILSGMRPSPALANSPTRTPTRTATPTPVIPNTATPAPTQQVGAACSPLTATITAPFVIDGPGHAGTFCWRISQLGVINSFNLSSLTVNGVNFTNMFVPASSLPAKVDGYWYILYVSTNPWFSHFEAQP